MDQADTEYLINQLWYKVGYLEARTTENFFRESIADQDEQPRLKRPANIGNDKKTTRRWRCVILAGTNIATKNRTIHSTVTRTSVNYVSP